MDKPLASQLCLKYQRRPPSPFQFILLSDFELLLKNETLLNLGHLKSRRCPRYIIRCFSSAYWNHPQNLYLFPWVPLIVSFFLSHVLHKPSQTGERAAMKDGRHLNTLVPNFRGCRDPGGGSPCGKILNPTENCCPSGPISKKKYCPCILEGRLITNVILIALHLQGPRSIIFICSLPLSKYAIDWDFIIKAKPSIKHVIDLEVKNITKPSLASTEAIVFLWLMIWNCLCKFYNDA